MKINIKDLIEKARKIYGELELDGYYGEQVVIKQDENLFMYISPWLSYRQVWECSKRILDLKEDE
jgi:hypothetical protein